MEKFIYPLFLAKCNQTRMLSDRGYEVPENDKRWLISEYNNDIDALFEEFKQHLGVVRENYANINVEKLSVRVDKKTEKSQDKLLVWYFPTFEEVKIDEIRSLINYITPSGKVDSTTVNHIITISNEKISSTASGLLGGINNVERFLFSDLSHNPTSHAYSSEYYRLTSEEKREFFEENKDITPSMMPIMSITDPVSRWLRFSVGDIIQITWPKINDDREIIDFRVVS